MKIAYLSAILILTLAAAGCNESPNNNVNQTSRTTTTGTTTTNPTSTTPTVANSKRLDLSDQGLTKLPNYVFSRTDLEELVISNNRITGALQGEIRNLKNLRILRAGNNQMTGVAAEIGQLQNLEILDLSNNKITGLPNELANLKNLKTLNLSGNQYSQQDLDVIRRALPNVNYIL
jgi:Leucine-rich repeat (LRR) protein